MLRSAAIYALIAAIAIADWLTPAGVVVGILFSVPILLSSISEDPRQVHTTQALCAGAFIVAAIFGRGPITPEAIWLPNRVFALVTILASGPLAWLLQRRRVAAESARELNALLYSLMAHDLRSPLALARDALAAAPASAEDPSLLRDVDARLRRSLRAIDLVLHAARADIRAGPQPAAAGAVDVGAELRDEVASFAQEAAHRGKSIVVDVPDAPIRAAVEPAVLRQAVAILVDNAVRYAVDGIIRVGVSLRDGYVRVSVRDGGPGFTARAATAPGGQGLGIRLCELLARRAGGTLEVAHDAPDGTEFVLRLPA